MADEMTTRERFQAVMSGRAFDRLPILEWAGWWDKTLCRWHGEQLPADLQDRYEICRHFGLDVYKQTWIGTHRAGCPKPPDHGLGIIACEADYDRIRPYLFPDVSETLGYYQCWKEWAEEQARGEIVVWLTVEGFFWFARGLFGIEPHLYAFYDHPDLMHRINSDLANWIIKTFDAVCSVVTPDFMTFGEDMSYNHGPMLSKDTFDEFLKPYYQRVLPILKAHGIIPIIDSDGDVTVPAYWFEDAGLDGILPLERQAGVDIARLREDHPAMRFIGHFDKMTMHKGEAVMRAEFERLLPVAAKGKYLIACDHQTPPAVSYDDYRLYISLFREYAAEAGRISRQILRGSGNG